MPFERWRPNLRGIVSTGGPVGFQKRKGANPFWAYSGRRKVCWKVPYCDLPRRLINTEGPGMGSAIVNYLENSEPHVSVRHSHVFWRRTCEPTLNKAKTTKKKNPLGEMTSTSKVCLGGRLLVLLVFVGFSRFLHFSYCPHSASE